MSGVIGVSRGNTQERILKTAAELFARFGYNGVSTREIASRADVNEVTIYRHYPRKRDLYLAVLSSELQRVQLRGDMLSNLASAGSGKAALACALELIASTLQHQPQLLRLLQFSSLEMNDELDLLLRKHLGELVEVLAHYLQPWVARGELRCADARTLVLTLIAIVFSRGALRRLFQGETDSAGEIFETYSEFCVA
jgi:AcrR family transcriptional regulator